MRKPDIFDEIIQCLKTGAQTGADTSMSEDVLRDLYARPVRKAAATAPVSAPARKPAVQPQAAPAQNPQGVPPAYAPDIPEWESLRTACAACMKCRLGPTRTNMVFADGSVQRVSYQIFHKVHWCLSNRCDGGYYEGDRSMKIKLEWQ